MKNMMLVLPRFIGHVLKAWFIAVVLVFILLWIFLSLALAKSYTIEITSAVSFIYAFRQTRISSRNPNIGIEEYRIRKNDSKYAAVFLSVGLFATTAYSLITTQNKFAELERLDVIGKNAAVDPDQNCQDIGVKYGRTSVRSQRGQYIKPSDNVTIPAECHGLPSTARGIRAGVENESRR